MIRGLGGGKEGEEAGKERRWSASGYNAFTTTSQTVRESSNTENHFQFPSKNKNRRAVEK